MDVQTYLRTRKEALRNHTGAATHPFEAKSRDRLFPRQLGFTHHTLDPVEAALLALFLTYWQVIRLETRVFVKGLLSEVSEALHETSMMSA